MRHTGRRLGNWLLTAGILVPFVVWWSSDVFLVFDALVAAGVVWSVWAGVERITLTPRYHDWAVSNGVDRPAYAAAGALVLLLVTLRQLLQVAGIDWVSDVAASAPDIRLRYAAVLDVAYVAGWYLLLVSVYRRPEWRVWYQRYRWEFMALVGLVAVAAGMRFVWLSDYPNILNGDEGLVGWWARGMLREAGPLEYTLTAMDGVGTFYLTLLGSLIWLFGSEEWVLRTLPALAGTVSVVSLSVFVRALYGPRVALFAAVLLVFTHTHIHFSRQLAVSYIYAAVFVPILLWGLWRMVETRRAWPAVVAAAAVSFHANFYVDAWAWAVLTLLVGGAWLVVHRSAMRNAVSVWGIYLGAALLGLGPQLVWAAFRPSGFFSRLEVDGSFVSGYVYREAEALQMSVIGYVLYLYQQALQAIYLNPFIDFYHADVPMLEQVSVGLALIGAVIVHNKVHTPRGILLLGWFWGGVTALAVFTLPISTYHYRLFVIVPMLMIFCALGLDAVYRLVVRFGSTRSAAGVAAVVLVVVAALNVDIYVNRLALDCRYGGDHMTQRAGAAARFLHEKDVKDAPVVIVGQENDMHAGTWKSFEYLNPTVTFLNRFPDSEPLVYADPGDDVYFLYIPERFLEAEKIEAGYQRVGDYETITMCGELFGYLTHTQAP